MKSTTAQRKKKKNKEKKVRRTKKRKNKTHTVFFFLFCFSLSFYFYSPNSNKGRGDILNRRNKQIEEGRLQPCHPLLRIHTHTQKDTVNAWVAIHFKSSAFFLFLFFFLVCLCLCLLIQLLLYHLLLGTTTEIAKIIFPVHLNPFSSVDLFLFSLSLLFFLLPVD